jgi:surface antigen
MRQVTHLGLALMILIVLATGIAAPKAITQKKSAAVDPFGIQAVTQSTDAASKVTAPDAVASIASVIDVTPTNQLQTDAYQTADQRSAKSTIALANDAIANVSPIQTTSSAKGTAQATKYTVKDGDTLWTIARQFGITTDSIKWSNGMSDADFVKPGTSLTIPSITGIVYTVKSGDTIEGLASRFKAQASLLSQQNDLIGNEDLAIGMQIIIPDGQIIEVAPAAPVTPARTQYASSSSVPGYITPSSGNNRFPWGYCTYYVASRRNIPWNGNAWQWYGNAIAYGRPVGRAPVAGAVMVTWESSVGHVAYVESVNGNSFTVSEMNYKGYGVRSSRTITTSSVPLIGFIY